MWIYAASCVRTTHSIYMPPWVRSCGCARVRARVRVRVRYSPVGADGVEGTGSARTGMLLGRILPLQQLLRAVERLWTSCRCPEEGSFCRSTADALAPPVRVVCVVVTRRCSSFRCCHAFAKAEAWCEEDVQPLRMVLVTHGAQERARETSKSCPHWKSGPRQLFFFTCDKWSHG